MTLADDTHTYACSRCRHTGSYCLEALWLAQAFSRVQLRAGHVLPAGAELVSATQFQGCGRQCNVLLIVRQGAVEITAGMPDCCDQDEALTPAARVIAQPLRKAAGTVRAQATPRAAGGGRTAHAAAPLHSPGR
jgi:hypothetical protein